MTTETVDIDQARGFVRDLEQAEEIYRRLLGLTTNQSEVLQKGVSPELLELVEAKEKELDRLKELEETLAPGRQAWIALRMRVSEDVKGEVQTVIHRVEEVLKDLLRLEEAEGQALTAKREETLGQIQRLDAARKMRGAYSRSQTSPTLLDQKE